MRQSRSSSLACHAVAHTLSRAGYFPCYCVYCRPCCRHTPGRLRVARHSTCRIACRYSHTRHCYQRWACLKSGRWRTSSSNSVSTQVCWTAGLTSKSGSCMCWMCTSATCPPPTSLPWHKALSKCAPPHCLTSLLTPRAEHPGAPL